MLTFSVYAYKIVSFQILHTILYATAIITR